MWSNSSAEWPRSNQRTKTNRPALRRVQPVVAASRQAHYVAAPLRGSRRYESVAFGQDHRTTVGRRGHLNLLVIHVAQEGGRKHRRRFSARDAATLV